MSILWILVQCTIILCYLASLHSAKTIKSEIHTSRSKQAVTGFRDTTKNRNFTRQGVNQQRDFNIPGKSRSRRSFVRPLFSMFNPLCKKAFRARAVVVYRGSGLKLTCDPCGYVRERIVWTKLPLESFYQSADSLDIKETIIPRNDEIDNTFQQGGNDVGIFYDEDMALGIRRAIESNAGIYQCKVKSPFQDNSYIDSRPLSYYYVEVKSVPFVQQVNLDDGQKPPSDRLLDNGEKSIMVYTLWSSWGSCSDCDIPGRRKRIGYCYALVPDTVFTGGVPCRSSLVPTAATSLLTLTKDIQLETPCMEYCVHMQETPVYGLGPFTGLFVHGGSNSVKTLDEQKRGQQTLRVEEATTLRLECPEAYIVDAVRWRRAGHVIQIPTEDPTEGESRIFMDPEGTLTFRSLILNDTNRYECHVNQRRMANYRVYVFTQIVDREETFEAFGFLSFLVGVYTSIFVVLLLGKYCLRQMVKQEMEKMEERPLLDEDAAAADDDNVMMIAEDDNVMMIAEDDNVMMIAEDDNAVEDDVEEIIDDE